MAAFVLGSVLVGQTIPKVHANAPWVVRFLVNAEKKPTSVGVAVLHDHPWLGALLLLAGTCIFLWFVSLVLDREARQTQTTKNAGRLAFFFVQGAVLASGVWLLTSVANNSLSGWLYWPIFFVTLLGLGLLSQIAQAVAEDLAG